MIKITIIDYGMGNILSLVKQFKRDNLEVVVSNSKEVILNSDKIILPGVGHFEKAMKSLEKNDLIGVLNEAVLVKKIPILGICLGMQLMTKSSEEGNVKGIGWIDAVVKKFYFKEEEQLNYKVPHVGWNSISIEKDSPLMIGIKEESSFYFVHSYYLELNSTPDTLNKTSYKNHFVSGFEKGNIFGVQYHPEKSHDVGKQLIDNFIKI